MGEEVLFRGAGYSYHSIDFSNPPLTYSVDHLIHLYLSSKPRGAYFFAGWAWMRLSRILSL